MNFLKGLALGLLSFLLFLSLSIFGMTFMVKNTLLNPDFVTSEIERLDVSSLTEELTSFQAPDGEAEGFEAALFNTVNKLEPAVKEQLGIAIHSVYDFLLDKDQDLDLALVLKNTLLGPDFIASLVDEFDISSLAEEYISTQLGVEVSQVPEYLSKYIDEIMEELKPAIKKELTAAADPLGDYLLGRSQNLRVIISLESVKEGLRDKLWEVVIVSPPPELAIIPRPMREAYFDEIYQQLTASIPPSFVLDESLIPPEVPAGITSGLAEAEKVLTEAKVYVGYFQLGYMLLIVLMVLLILGIVLISREVKYITRSLGTTFLVLGAFEYAGIFIAKYFSRTQLALPEMPTSLQAWLPGFYDNLLAPLEMLSLGLLVGGIVLIIASIVYPRLSSS